MKFYRTFVIAAIVSLLCTACVQPNSAPAAGFRTIEIAPPAREAPISVSLWYPPGAGGSQAVIGANKVFQGVSVRQDAAIADGEFPVILLAHGGLRAAPQMSAWIASYLALHGFIVAEPHPPHLGADDAQTALIEPWLRPADLAATLAALEGDAVVQAHLQNKSIGVLGFLLGGERPPLHWPGPQLIQSNIQKCVMAMQPAVWTVSGLPQVA